MQLKAFRVRKFRNIEDSGEVELPDVLTCVVGKNQSGKSSLLRALHKFNPRFPEPYDMRREWPRGQRHQRNEQQVVCEVRFRLSSEELKKLGEIAGQELRGEDVVVTKDYKGNFKVQFPEDSPLFSSTLNSNLIDAIYQDLPAPTQPVGENFRTQAIKCNLEAKKYAKNGRFEELNRQVRARHVAALHKQLTDVKTAPQWVNENQFIEDYKAALTEFKAKIATESTKQQKAHDYIVSQLPTFIYMDDYKAFRGRSDLEGLKERLHNKKLVLSEEDETFLMILKLGSLDLDNLIKQGNSEDQEVLHDRQIDLQDAATTLTSNVAGRWGQHEYQLQFRADGQVFFTEIEETNKNIGMIPLEEQSKGFQWFFSFDLHFMHDSDGTFEGCVLLLDEPGLHLHPGGQMDLLDRLDAYARKNTLIYTTHLPFLVDLREPKRLKVIQQTEMGAIVSDDLGGTQTDERLTLQAALGMSANQGCLVSKRNLLVEGVHDYWIIAELSNIFEREGRVCLPEDVLVTAAGGESEIVHTAMFMLGQELTVVALFDSDSAGNLAEGKLRNKWITRYKNAQAVTVLFADALGMPGKEATIEDLFPEDYYMEKVRKSHALKLLSKGLASEEITLNGSGPVLPRLQQCFDKLEVDFNKGLVGKLIRRDLIRCNSVGSLPPGVAEKGAALLTVLHTAFDNFDKQTSKEERAVGKEIDQQIAKAERSNGEPTGAASGMDRKERVPWRSPVSPPKAESTPWERYQQRWPVSAVQDQEPFETISRAHGYWRERLSDRFMRYQGGQQLDGTPVRKTIMPLPLPRSLAPIGKLEQEAAGSEQLYVESLPDHYRQKWEQEGISTRIAKAEHKARTSLRTRVSLRTEELVEAAVRKECGAEAQRLDTAMREEMQQARKLWEVLGQIDTLQNEENHAENERIASSLFSPAALRWGERGRNRG